MKSNKRLNSRLLGDDMEVIRPSFREDEGSQVPALQLLQNMGWTYLTPKEALASRKDNYQNVILEDVLESQLKKINKIEYKDSFYSFQDASILDAVYSLKTIPLEGLVQTNEKVFELLTLGKSYKETIKGDRKSYNLKYIDWDHPENNVYHVTDEYKIETRYLNDRTRRPDIILFINGIPVVVIECKRTDLKDPIEEAISQNIRNQKENEIPHLFIYSQIIIALCPSSANKPQNRCKYATTGVSSAFWCAWNEQSEYKNDLDQLINAPLSTHQKDKLFYDRYKHSRLYFEKIEKSKRQITHQDITLYGLCQTHRVLELIKKFILYDAGVKKIARYQQYFSVKDALQRITTVTPSQTRSSGVIWHTQGSGKSLSMVMLAKSIAMEASIQEPKVILITDRVNLDLQIYKTFHNCKITLERAKSGVHLAHILQSQKASVIATTAFKFEALVNAKHLRLPSKDIIVLVDEAHRTQYGEIHTKISKTLPNACFIAYTGTPLNQTEKNTMRQFGDIIGIPYVSRDAIDDKVTVPLLYEDRIIPQKVEKSILDTVFERMTKTLNQDQKNALQKKFTQKEMLTRTNQRIFMISMDVSDHFSKYWKGKGFKGQLAVNRIATAFKYKKYFDELGNISTEVIISKTDDRSDHTDIAEEETALQKYNKMIKESFGTHQQYEKETIAKFDSKEPPDLLIVVNKLLTGFDVPRNTILYLDKEMKEHTLLQAISRVNRIYDKKEFGYVIDYYGNVKQLREAISQYDNLAQSIHSDSFDRANVDEINNFLRDVESEIQKLFNYHSDLTSLFNGVENKQDITAYEKFLSNKEERDLFYERFSKFGKSLHQALSSVSFVEKTSISKIKEYKSDLKFFHALKKNIQKMYAEVIDYKDYEPKIENLLNTYVQAKEARTIVPLVNIYDSQFDQEIKNQTDRSKALAIIHRTKKYISENAEKDPVFYERLSKLIQEVLDEYKENRLNEAEFLKKAERYKNEALTRTGDQLPSILESKPEVKPFFGVLKKNLDCSNQLKKEQMDQLANMSIKINQIIKENIIVDWEKNIDIQNKIKNKIEDYTYEQKDLVGFDFDFEKIDVILDELIQIAKSCML